MSVRRDLANGDGPAQPPRVTQGGYLRRDRARMQRTGGACGLGALAASLREGVYANATDQTRERYAAAERRQAVFSAWNEVCAGTREGQHVTGLFYAPDTNTLVVYTDGATWTQELTMMREIIRARMEAAGASVAEITCKTSRPGHGPSSPTAPATHVPLSPKAERPPAPARRPLTPDERDALAASSADIDDPKLRRALTGAWAASLEWKKGQSV